MFNDLFQRQKKKNKPETEKCTLCGLDVLPGMSNPHIKCARNTVTVQVSGGPERVFQRKADTFFHCNECEYNAVERMAFKVGVYILVYEWPLNEPQTHVEQMHLSPPSSRILEEIEAQRSESPERTDTPPLVDPSACKEFLERHGLVICETLLICVQCKSVVDYTKIRQHFLKKHKDLDTPTSMQSDFNALALRAHPNLVAQPVHPKGPVQRNPYLETRSSYMLCLSCNHCYSAAAPRLTN